MNRCPDPTEWVLYAAEELPTARVAILRAHLGTCAACRQALEAVSRGLAALDRLEGAAGLRPQTEETLRRRLAEAAARKASRPWIIAFVGRHRLAAAAALILWVTLAAAILAPSHQPSPKWITDTQVVEEITAITAAVEMLEVGNVTVAHENGANHKAPPADKMEEELEWFLQELSDVLGVAG